MPTRPTIHRPAGHQARQRAVEQVYERWRGTSSERGYTGRWQKARLTYLARSPLCVFCERKGRVTAATVVDHIIPHKGDSDLFWDTSNWQSLCKTCHDSAKQRSERVG